MPAGWPTSSRWTSDVQRQLIEIWLQQGRRSDAVRRYDVLRTRTLREFGEEPGFTLSDLAR